MKRSPEIAKDDASWCMQHGIAVYQVGDVYDTDADGEPITEADREKWFVSILVGSFPEDLVRAIPLASTAAEAEANAVKYLGPHCQQTN